MTSSYPTTRVVFLVVCLAAFLMATLLVEAPNLASSGVNPRPSASIIADSAAVAGSFGFAGASPTNYTVTFTETGPHSGPSWCVGLNGTNEPTEICSAWNYYVAIHGAEWDLLFFRWIGRGIWTESCQRYDPRQRQACICGRHLL